MHHDQKQVKDKVLRRINRSDTLVGIVLSYVATFVIGVLWGFILAGCRPATMVNTNPAANFQRDRRECNSMALAHGPQSTSAWTIAYVTCLRDRGWKRP